MDRSQRIEPRQLIVGVGHDLGRQRKRNEDSIFSFSSVIATSSTSMPFGIFVVADGMGGHQNGELASEYAARTMGNYLVTNLYNPLFSPKPQPPTDALQEIMIRGIYESHNSVNKYAQGGGTTLTAALVVGTQMTVAHVGDSRAYAIFMDGKVEVLTRDHSLVKRLEELGQITAEEAAVHPQKAMLYRALGQGEAPEPDIFTTSLPHPGYLLICSDGLWGVLSEEEIFNVIVKATSLAHACQTLIKLTNAAGGPDNISVILVSLSE